MTPEERELMIKIGKQITIQGEAIMEIKKSLAPTAPVKSTFDIPQPPRVSIVDHDGLASRFKMEIGFEQGSLWSQEQRMDHSIKLLTEMEELLKDYGVINLTGNYHVNR